MKLQEKKYKQRNVCTNCLSLSVKKSHKVYKCDNCKETINNLLSVYLMHKGNRCIDNDVSTRWKRYNLETGVIRYE